MYEKRSDYFTELLSDLGVDFDLKDNGSINNNKALRFNSKKIMVYYNEATSTHGAYFALNKSNYSSFKSRFWLEARNDRKESSHFKWIPYPGEEHKALADLIQFFQENVAK